MDGPTIRDYIDARKKSGMSWDEFRALKDKNKGDGISDSDMVAWRKQLDSERERKLNRGKLAEDVETTKVEKRSRRKHHTRSDREKSRDDQTSRDRRHRSSRHENDDSRHKHSRRHEHGKDRSRGKRRDVPGERVETSHRRRSISPLSRKDRHEN